MSASLQQLQRIGAKLFLEDEPRVALDAVIPVFHSWIQTGAVDGLLIDVADYSHVEQGPGVLLIAHEGNYALDMSHNRPGVLYQRGRPQEGDLESRTVAVLQTTLRAASRLEQDLGCGVRGDELQIVANDRLHAPNESQSFAAFSPILRSVLDRMYAGGSYETCRDEDARERFNVSVKASSPVGVATLLERLSA